METILICLACALIGGLMLSRLTKKMNLPAVTAYLVAGLLLGPFALGRLNIPGLGFQTLEQVETMGIVTRTALGFIAFTIGNEFRLSQLKTMGRSAIIIGILQAVITTIVVDDSDCPAPVLPHGDLHSLRHHSWRHRFRNRSRSYLDGCASV